MPSRRSLAPLSLALTLIAIPFAAWAQDAAQPQPQSATDAQPSAPSAPEGPAQGGDPAGSNTDQPTDKPQLRAFCTDRPTKANVPCVLDEGHFQVESDVFNATFTHDNGVNTDTYLYTNPTLKYGLTHDTDLEVNWAPYETVRTHDLRSGVANTVSGVGDVYLRAKIGLAGVDGGTVAATLIPYVKAPAAPLGVGNGAWEGGLIAPITVKLSSSVNLTFDPELDILKNADDDGRHANMAQLINLSWSIPENVTLYGELSSNVNFDPSGTVTQYSADLAVTWGLPHDLQLDVGVNLGLNHDTPAVQAYTGVSRRF